MILLQTVLSSLFALQLEQPVRFLFPQPTFSLEFSTRIAKEQPNRDYFVIWLHLEFAEVFLSTNLNSVQKRG